MKRRSVAIGLVALFVVVIIPAFIEWQRESRTYSHQEFIKGAEGFRRRLLDRVPIGSPRSTVWDYLEPLNVDIRISTTRHRTGAPKVDYWIPLSTESHPSWFCERGEIGVSLVLVEEKLVSAEVGTRGLGCL